MSGTNAIFFVGIRKMLFANKRKQTNKNSEKRHVADF